jgi:GNAT superfamily N-acetyltransferase
MKCEIRECRLEDSGTIAELTSQLGYAVPVEEIKRRVRAIADKKDHAVIVACGPDGTVIGWMDVGLTFHLQSGTYCEIGGLVVAASARSQGIGRELVAYAEQWAAEREVEKVLVRSNTKREDAHRFYLREKYRMVKISAVFEKKLEAD